MNRVQAMTTIDNILKHKFKYLYQQKKLNIQTLHLSFLMDSKTHNIQMTFEFQDKWVDICVKEIEAVVDYYADVFVLVFNILQGKTSFEYSKNFIDNMWGGLE